MTSFRTVLVLTFLALLVAPTVAIACSMVSDPRSPQIPQKDLRFAKVHEAARLAWVKHRSWQSSSISINQEIQLPGMDESVLAAFAQQRSIKIMVNRTGDGEYTDDADPTTTCARVGERVWSTPRVLVRQTPKAIFMTAIARKKSGSTAGCDVVANSCDGMDLRTISLDAPIGKRRIYAVKFA